MSPSWCMASTTRSRSTTAMSSRRTSPKAMASAKLLLSQAYWASGCSCSRGRMATIFRPLVKSSREARRASPRPVPSIRRRNHPPAATLATRTEAAAARIQGERHRGSKATGWLRLGTAAVAVFSVRPTARAWRLG